MNVRARVHRRHRTAPRGRQASRAGRHAARRSVPTVYERATAEQTRRAFGLPEDYRVDAVLASGAWDLFSDSQHRPHLVQSLTDLGLGDLATGDGPGSLRRLTHAQVGHTSEFVHEGRRVWFVPVMGTAVMSWYLHAACLLGARRIVLVGTVGGLSPSLHTADLIVPNRSDGTHSAWMYHRSNDPATRPDPTMAASLARRLRAALPSGATIAEGPTTTCETILAETAQDVAEWSAAGYLGVEMEAAVTFAIGRHFDIPAAAALYVADTLLDEVGFLDPAYADSAAARSHARQVQYDVGLAELLQLP